MVRQGWACLLVAGLVGTLIVIHLGCGGCRERTKEPAPTDSQPQESQRPDPTATGGETRGSIFANNTALGISYQATGDERVLMSDEEDGGMIVIRVPSGELGSLDVEIFPIEMSNLSAASEWHRKDITAREGGAILETTPVDSSIGAAVLSVGQFFPGQLFEEAAILIAPAKRDEVVVAIVRYLPEERELRTRQLMTVVENLEIKGRS